MNANDPARIAETPVWAHESTLNEDSAAVFHTREGEVRFQASTGNLQIPLVSQHLRIEVIDRLRVHRVGRENEPVGLVCDREEVEIILTQDEEGRPFPTEVVSWPIDEARKLHKALGDLLDAFDTTGGE